MAKILKSIDSIGPGIPGNLKSKIQIVATYALNEREAKIMHASLNAVSKQIVCDKLTKKELRNLIILLTEKGSYCVEDDFSMGSLATYAVFSIQPWRDKEWTDYNLLTCFIEEFTHHFWGIEDEEEVKYKVLEIVKNHVDSEIFFEDLFLKDWKKGYPHLYEDE
ncbi:hypothetical protein ON064_00685 [Planococcus sp. A6]|uniref:hypothetical protein n=1 Tax=Planococcus sp. A6 TaxID=2992760 RepID=UPI00237B0E25|nr:hypothetical protein [Planococcus sp. A6]MDE0581565.1 hypothetical protein [Planococcus sp. A6]